VTELKVLFDILPALNTPILSLTCWLVWRIYNNHLPHMQKQIDELMNRTSQLEGIKEGVEQELRRKR
jgi:uncharacterized protein with HEPN domain